MCYQTCHFIANHRVWPIDLAKTQKVKSGMISDTNETHDSILCCVLFSYQTFLIDSNPNGNDILSHFEMCFEAIILIDKSYEGYVSRKYNPISFSGRIGFVSK